MLLISFSEQMISTYIYNIFFPNKLESKFSIYNPKQLGFKSVNTIKLLENKIEYRINNTPTNNFSNHITDYTKLNLEVARTSEFTFFLIQAKLNLIKTISFYLN